MPARVPMPGSGGSPSLRIGARTVEPGGVPFIIAEAGVNHNGKVALARRLVRLAADGGADAVKFQTFRTDAIAVANAGRAPYQESAIGHGTQREMLRKLELPLEEYAELRDLANGLGIEFLSTPFDEKSADFLARLGVPAFKVGSGDLDNHPLLLHVARKKRPVLLSTGMATMNEVKAATAVLQAAKVPFCVLHCTSSYPAALQSLNLRAIGSLARQVTPLVGYSDHSQAVWVGAAAVSLGAVVVEKHVTTDMRLPGPDHAASLEAASFKQYVDAARGAHAALGSARKAPTPEERAVARVARKSLVAARPLRKGHVLRMRDLAAKRPAGGISPSRYLSLLGRPLRRSLKADEPLGKGDLL